MKKCVLYYIHRIKRFFWACLTASCALVIISCTDPSADQPIVADVGIYWGRGAFSPSIEAVKSCAGDTSLTFELFDEDDLAADKLPYRCVVIPGGDPREMAVAIGDIGRHNLRAFVEHGGGLVGLGGGAVIADTMGASGIGILRGLARWPVDRIAPYPDYILTDITRSPTINEDWYNLPNRYITLYRWGPEFLFASNYIATIYFYGATATPAVVAFQYYAGRVFLSGCNIEFEEGGNNDGSDFADELADPDSEWDLLKRALIWAAGVVF